MRNLILFMHTSLDGFVAGPQGEMNWIKFNDELFDYVGTVTNKTDTALYSRVTYEMMQNYWPNAAQKPDATKHDIEHSAWYSEVSKVVLSRTMSEKGLVNTLIISNQIADNINKIKNQDGKKIIIFGSPGASHALISEDLIDEYWLFVNPVLLGEGIPLFKGVSKTTRLNLLESKTFSCGVIALHYERKRD